MAERLLGVETEYAISAMQGQEAADRRIIVRHLLDLAHTTLPNVQDGSSSGLFLENAARLYLDCGLHLEYSTPECANPWDAVRYVEAGHRTMLNLIQKMTDQRTPELQTGYRVNVDYSGAGATWGCHESYLHRMSPASLPPHLIPHLVTRIVYTGAGGFESFSGGLKFTLSPRAAHIERTISSDSTSDRGIFHTKDEPLCAGHHRLHVLCGESLCSKLAMFVKFVAASLIVAMAEAGLCPGDAVQLDSPLAALRTVAADPQQGHQVKLDAIEAANMRHKAGPGEPHLMQQITNRRREIDSRHSPRHVARHGATLPLGTTHAAAPESLQTPQDISAIRVPDSRPMRFNKIRADRVSYKVELSKRVEICGRERSLNG
ncbi:MAG: proteasome accessory factor PafA2 family protein [Terracidiphilus sp.]|jgi:hypothetical protein